MHELIDRQPGVEGLLERIEGKIGAQRARHTPPNDPPGKDINDEGRVDEAAPGGDVGEVGHPQLVGTRRHKLAVDQIRRPRRGLIGDRRLEPAASDRPCNPICCINRSTEQRATASPSRRSCRQTLRAPYKPKFASQTRWICAVSRASRWARAERRSGCARHVLWRRCCTARSKSLTSLCRLQSHPAQYVSGIPSAAILLSISHPIRCSTRCLANVRARISGPMIAL